MFSGIIRYTGIVKDISNYKKYFILKILSPIKFKKSEIGSSISCSGVCLTLLKYKNKLSYFYISNETLNKSNFKYLKKNKLVNFEKSLKYGDNISGHFVQGHVDTICKIIKIREIGKSWYINFDLSNKYKKYVIYKGSIAINGVSLTVSKVLRNEFQIVIIPHTLKKTNLISLKENDLVNVEFDLLGKYLTNFSR
tara:strand:+ start:74 stop:658 length:585 start_codon:yes stop_codon:yes gene_type:complete